jgi:AcrR family transcriptional regulator
LSTLKERTRIPKARPYRMRRRAEHVEATRRRIVEAAVRLHTTIGAARTTLTGVAEEAGVTRLTLYRHFADQDELFVACRAHWRAEHPSPDPSAWAWTPGFEQRLRAGLNAIYGWYRENADDLYPLNRDLGAMPQPFQDGVRQREAQLAALILEAAGPAGENRPRLRAAVGHVISFWTWRSLAIGQGLSDADAIALAMGMVDAA